MRRIAAFAAAALSLALALAASPPPPAGADTTGLLLIACENIVPGIDGDLTDATFANEYNEICGERQITPAEIANLEAAYGNGDGEMEYDDLFDVAGLDDDQLRDTCTAAAPGCALLAFAFVDDEDTVTLDYGQGVQSLQSGSLDFDCNSDGNTLTTDADCSDNTIHDGDGVVVFHLLNLDSEAGDNRVINVIQEGVLQTATIKVRGEPVSLELSFTKSKIQVSGPTAADVDTCEQDTDLFDPIATAKPNVTIVRVIPRDAGGRDLTRVGMPLSSDQITRAIVSDLPPPDVFKGRTNGSVKLASGIGQYAVICGGTARGVANIKGEISLEGPNYEMTQPLIVVGEPSTMTLVAVPLSILCDGVATTAITATVRDIDGTLVADGTPVHFGLTVLGVVNPINAVTMNGVASTVARGISAYTQGMPVTVTAGRTGDDLQSSILITCTGFDTDGDGMPNTFEAAKPCLNSIVSDSHIDQDLDGIASLAEYHIGTDPCDSDTDDDGCTDGAELSGVHELGGDRNPLDPWDFFDVTDDALIDLSDALAILGKFGTGVNDVGYLPAYDRYSPNPAKPWRTAHAVDGTGIDLTDALVNLASFGDDCS